MVFYSYKTAYQKDISLYFKFTALEPRSLTRFEVRKYARQAYEMGIRYIGGCCGFESRHIREMAEEVIASTPILEIFS